MLVGGRQARLPAKGKGDPKVSACGIPLMGEQAEAAHARVSATSLVSPLAAVPEAARAVSHGQGANIGKPDERFAKKR